MVAGRSTDPMPFPLHGGDFTRIVGPEDGSRFVAAVCGAYLDVWKRLPADSTVEEVIRNFFVRQPRLWVGA
jgi:hypothetical protein